MTKLRDRRAELAGVGTSGSLVAAVAAVALLVGGVVTFSAWPGGPSGAPDPSVGLAPLAPSTVAQAAGELVVAATAPAAGGVTPGGAPGVDPGAPAPEPGTPASAGRQTEAGGTAGAGLGGAGVDVTGATVPSEVAAAGDAVARLAETARGTGERLGSGLEGGGMDTAASLSGVDPRAAAAVERAAIAAGETVARTGHAVAGALDALGS